MARRNHKKSRNKKKKNGAQANCSAAPATSASRPPLRSLLSVEDCPEQMPPVFDSMVRERDVVGHDDISGEDALDAWADKVLDFLEFSKKCDAWQATHDDENLAPNAPSTLGAAKPTTTKSFAQPTVGEAESGAKKPKQ
ncbi:hypothetical protein SEMRO_731_G194230.1 [Seminavis robusta]|uniref:Uncharacterized protein n=1 Tax=Seminavis robusta TaxID=568900 RepID=A0A9N8E6N9_9STRA|nr:hypothetical protein SEMRO_731_G194230.1 [Seminavis robusta]|eukprot:Sro731_g194230.1 n/a (139) ;mRNA; f:23832-24248